MAVHRGVEKLDLEITIASLTEMIGIGHSGIKKNSAKLKEAGVIERLGSDMAGS